MYNRDSATSTYGCMFTIRHLVGRAQVEVVVHSLLVFGTTLELPLLVGEGGLLVEFVLFIASSWRYMYGSNGVKVNGSNPASARAR